MPLTISHRKGSRRLIITGTVVFADGTRRRVRCAAQSRDPVLAREQAAAIEGQMLRDAWHGQRAGARSFAEAAISYVKASPRKPGEQKRLGRIGAALGNVTLGAVDQVAIDNAKARMFRADVSRGTVLRELIVPIRSVLNHAARRGWCTVPPFEVPRQPAGRTRFVTPGEAERLIEAAAPHLRPLFLFLIGTGARVSEALELDWRDVDLQGARAIFWLTKGGNRRIASLPARLVAELARLGHREGPVFRWETLRPTKKRDGQPLRSMPYRNTGREGGGQFKTGWRSALRRAGLDPALSPHSLRHSWATWFYGLHRDLLSLKVEGGWSSVSLCERYAHLLPAAEVSAVREFWRLAPVESGTGEAQQGGQRGQGID